MTRSTALASQRIRQRKLNTRTALGIIREEDLDAINDELQANVQNVDTGVERGEINEHHLQAALSSQTAAIGGKVAQIYIPTPDAVQSSIDYEKLYPLTYSSPTGYIRFSSTVEDCAGCPYDMDEEDDAFLKLMNKKRNASAQCSANQFEEVMHCFEETAQTQQPFAAVDSPPVLSYDEIEASMDDYLDENARAFTKLVYEHWKTRRLEMGNKSLTISLKVCEHQIKPAFLTDFVKFEDGLATDDADPYVCFRRREVRQIRKTRGRDAHSAEKLKKLRKELEDAREMVAMIRQREISKREQMAIDRTLFEQRANLRQVKQNLPDQYKDGDEDLLINQKPKKKPVDISQRLPNVQQLQRRPDGRVAEADLLLLSDLHADQERHLTEQINLKISQHQTWNEGWVDFTKAPLTPPLESSTRSTFRTATTEYLPTPPASTSSEHSGDVTTDFQAMNLSKLEAVAVRYASPAYDGSCHSQPSYRRRYGRGGRLFIDRRGMRTHSKSGLPSPVAERYKYDDDDDEDGQPIYYVDPYDINTLNSRARILPSPPTQAQLHLRRAQMEAASQGGNHYNTSVRPPRQPGSD
ncbi:enhancer of polycomb-like protein, partial [Lecanoromycetidae sp. Uapishka_2]